MKACRRMGVIAENEYGTTISNRGCTHRCNAYERETIPIEWLRYYFSVVQDCIEANNEKIEASDFPRILEIAIQDWRKENGRKTHDSEDNNTL